MKEVELLLGRKLTNIEVVIFRIYKDNLMYRATKGENGNLKYILIN
jgi:hypothetical protein